MYPPPHDGYPKYSAPPQMMAPPPPPPPHFQPMPTGIPVAAPMHIQSQAPIRWSTGLFDCFEDCTNCCVTIWCPCITFGQIAEIVDRGSSSCATSGALYALILWISGLSCLYSCFYRSKLRSQYVLEESPCPDCLVHCCCEPCALCQENRELKIRGFDMSIGWQANVERQSRGVTLLPPMQPGMMR